MLLPVAWLVGCPLDERQLHPIPDNSSTSSGGSAGESSTESAGGSSSSSGGASTTNSNSTSGASSTGGSSQASNNSTTSGGTDAGGATSTTSSTTGEGGAGNQPGTPECPDLDGNQVADCEETLLENASFDANLNDWHEEVNALANWEDEDALGFDASGSVSITNRTVDEERDGLIMRGVWQCVPAEGGKKYQLLTQIRVSTDNEGQGWGGINVWFSEQPDCTGTLVTASTPLLGTTTDWSQTETIADAPVESKSMLVRLVVNKHYQALPVTIDFDNVLIRVD